MFEELQESINQYLADPESIDPDHIQEKIEEALEEKKITEQQYKTLLSQLD